MILALLIWLFKKYVTPALLRHNIQPFRFLLPLKKAVTLLAFICFSAGVMAQEQTVKYNVLHSGKIVGHMNLYQKRNGDNLYLKMISEVKMRFIMSINVNINEESVFENGKLISSHVCRNVNGKEKANRQTKAEGDAYQTLAEGKSGRLDKKQINANLMLLYCHEPADNAQIYSDNFQQFLQVKQVSPHVYRVNLPDGNYNFYSYNNGICSMVDIHHSLYTIQIQLV
ncbi:hypothetical protein SAMN05216464_109144 [Mucilaginibacter pineti]|uniref:DUF3108 domain-containing protein n=1 Tax=Mucilaginibacter pineti TaxID=1391627 RepID=A0A1G7FNW2_9SPHI|nr:DUF6134 family protein [Mucilaginibacter pineti]SDE77546.1 hypothetical protein SAMN05216464_109144 [Mucilaginibacter pineti]